MRLPEFPVRLTLDSRLLNYGRLTPNGPLLWTCGNLTICSLLPVLLLRLAMLDLLCSVVLMVRLAYRPTKVRLLLPVVVDWVKHLSPYITAPLVPSTLVNRPLNYPLGPTALSPMRLNVLWLILLLCVRTLVMTLVILVFLDRKTPM